MRKTNTIICFALSLITLSALSLTVYAADESTTVNEQSTDKTAQTEVDLTVNPYYIVTIPKEVTLDGSALISASVFTKSNDYIKVSLTDTGDFKVTNGDSQSLDYEVKDGEVVWSEDSYMTFEADGEKTLTFERKEADAIYTGEYTGTVTFTVSCETKND